VADVSRFKLVGSEALRSMGANLSTSVAATMTVLIGMCLLGLFIALGTWVVSWSDHVKRQLEAQIYFTESASPKQVNAVRAFLDEKKLSGEVKEYRYISSADALRIMQKRQPDLVDTISSNPLPPSYTVTPERGEMVKTLSRDIRRAFKAPVCRRGVGDANGPLGVECVKDGEQTSKRILQVARVISIMFLVAVIVLLVASVLLIANTIRLSIFSRRREIEVMKLVGATNWFVRGPFMLEGLLCGGVGALAAVVLLLLGKEMALPAILGHIDTSSDVKALSFGMTALILLGVGLVVGALGSGMTLRRYLRV
jgi:cell division transport system permease protein